VQQTSVHSLPSRDPANGRRRRSRGRAERGLTLIEISIALAIAAVLFAAVVTGVGGLTGARAKEAAGRLSGTIRALYDEAALSGRTCRLVFELPPGKSEAPTRYWAECAQGAVASSKDRDEELRQATAQAEDEAKGRGTDPRRQPRSYDLRGSGTVSDAMAAEQKRLKDRSRFSGFNTEEVIPQQVPAGVRVSVWTRQQKKPVSEGLAYLYFHPQGYTERAMIFLTQGGNEWTIDVAPLTGKTAVVPRVLEVPR
jgi:general secretion pathway protein H